MARAYQGGGIGRRIILAPSFLPLPNPNPNLNPTPKGRVLLEFDESCHFPPPLFANRATVDLIWPPPPRYEEKGETTCWLGLPSVVIPMLEAKRLEAEANFVAADEAGEKGEGGGQEAREPAREPAA